MDFHIVEKDDRLSIEEVGKGGSIMTIIKEDILRTLDNGDMRAILLSVFESGYDVGRQVEKYDNRNS